MYSGAELPKISNDCLHATCWLLLLKEIVLFFRKPTKAFLRCALKALSENRALHRVLRSEGLNDCAFRCAVTIAQIGRETIRNLEDLQCILASHVKAKSANRLAICWPLLAKYANNNLIHSRHHGPEFVIAAFRPHKHPNCNLVRTLKACSRCGFNCFSAGA